MIESRLEDNLIVSVNPTEDCNLSCKYCRVPKDVKTNVMSKETLKNLYNEISKEKIKNKYIIWHGGEPTLVGEEFYSLVADLQKDIDNIRNGIQTNGTLLTEGLIEIFKNNEFRIGISLDGPKEIHDSKRIYKDGSGSFEKVMNGIRLLREYGADFAVLSLLTNDSIAHLKEIYDTVRKTGANGAKFEVFFPGGKGKKYRDKFYVKPEDYTKSMIKLYDMWIHEDNRKDFRVDPLDKIVESFFSGHSRACDYAGACGTNFLSIDSNGDIYVCGRFVGVKEFRIGNINKNTLREALDHEVCQEMVKRRIEARKRCIDNNCKYVDVCNGGCAYESFTFHNDLCHITPYCNSRKEIFDYIYNDLKNQGF